MPEDKFTALLHYLIESIPSIGQGIVDVICQKSELPTATFKMAVDHPNGDAENKPDFMLCCKEFDILCEHKLGSDLGERQLERYLGLSKTRPTFLVLISNRVHSISEDVLQSNFYLRPKGSVTPIFYWEDFYPVIASHTDRLAQDFAKFMRDLGMASSPLAEEWKQLFQSSEVAEKFSQATIDMRIFFNEQRGARCQLDPSRLGIQVKHPNEWLHLIYIDASKAGKLQGLEIRPPHLTARVYVKAADAHQIEHLTDAEIQSENGLIIGRVKSQPASWDKELVLRYVCTASLENYLTEKMAETRAKLLSFGKSVFEFVANVHR